MKDGECVKYAGKGHIAKECRTGYQNNPATSTEESPDTPAVKLIEGRERKRGTGSNETPVSKRRSDLGRVGRTKEPSDNTLLANISRHDPLYTVKVYLRR